MAESSPTYTYGIADHSLKSIPIHIINKKMSLSKAIDAWILQKKENRVSRGRMRESTLSYITSLLNTVSQSWLGKLNFSTIRPSQIEKRLGEIEAKTMRIRTQIYLNAFFEDMVHERLISENPCSFVENPEEYSPKDKFIPSDQELSKFMDELRAQSPKYYLFAQFLAYTGLRRGEALALTWSDIDLDNMAIRINKAYDRTTKSTTDPKTKSSFRNVPIFPEAMEVIRQLDPSTKSVFDFIGKTACSHNFRKLAEKCGMKDITLHSFRHIFTTRLYELGVDENVIKKWDGHSKLSVTKGVYTHIKSDFEQEQISKIARNSKKKPKFCTPKCTPVLVEQGCFNNK